MRSLLLACALVGAACGSDAKTPTVDAAAEIDAPAVTLDCPTYCTTIQKNCTGANAQYGGATADDALAHCMATCGKMTAGALADTSGNTLGCHLYHAGAAASAAATHCIHAGPAGGAVSGTGVCGDSCTNFCALEIGACGLSGAAATGQYASMGECMTACNGFDKTHAFTVEATAYPSTNPKGDSLACRLYHATNAAISAANATTHCPHTAATTAAGNPCNGAATP